MVAYDKTSILYYPFLYISSHSGWYKSCTFNWRETTAQPQIPPLPGVNEGCGVDVLHQLRQSLGEEGQVHFVPDVVFGPLQQVQQRLQERTQLWMEGREQVRGQKPLHGDLRVTSLAFGNNQTRILTAFLEAGEALILGHSAAGAARLTGRTCQCVEATERAELCPLFLLCHFSCLQKLRTCWFPTSMGL